MSRRINLEIETILTAGGFAEIATAILECLLFQRNQIDLVYSRFRSLVNCWLTNELNYETSLHGYLLERQRKKAIETKQAVSDMSKLIMEAFDKHTIKSLRFLFGATSATPKEAYTVHFPRHPASCLNTNDHHRLQKNHLNQLLISLVTHEELSTVFSKDLSPTNIFMEVELLQSAKDVAISSLTNLFPTVVKTKLPKSCKDIHLHVQHKKPKPDFNNDAFNCCRMPEGFDGHCQESTKECVEKLQNEIVLDESTWWESEIIIRGFKEKLIKGRSIWNI